MTIYSLAYSFPRRRQWHPTPVLLPGKSHGRRSLVGCSPWGRKESDTTQPLHFHFWFSCIGEGNGNPFQCSCLENPRDGGAWWAAVEGVTQSWTRLKWLSSSILLSVYCSMSSSNCCFLSCIQASQEAGNVVWYSYLIKNIHSLLWSTVKAFSIVNEAELDFLKKKFPCFFYDPANVGNLISDFSAFSKFSLFIWKFSVHVQPKPAWRILSIILLACEMSAILQ